MDKMIDFVSFDMTDVEDTTLKSFKYKVVTKGDRPMIRILDKCVKSIISTAGEMGRIISDHNEKTE